MSIGRTEEWRLSSLLSALVGECSIGAATNEEEGKRNEGIIGRIEEIYVAWIPPGPIAVKLLFSTKWR